MESPEQAGFAAEALEASAVSDHISVMVESLGGVRSYFRHGRNII
jgi:hypothetical protein